MQVTDEVYRELKASTLTTSALGKEEQGEDEQAEIDEEEGRPRCRQAKSPPRNASQSPTLMMSQSRSSIHGVTRHTCIRRNMKDIC